MPCTFSDSEFECTDNWLKPHINQLLSRLDMCLVAPCKLPMLYSKYNQERKLVPVQTHLQISKLYEDWLTFCRLHRHHNWKPCFQLIPKMFRTLIRLASLEVKFFLPLCLNPPTAFHFVSFLILQLVFLVRDSQWSPQLFPTTPMLPPA